MCEWHFKEIGEVRKLLLERVCVRERYTVQGQFAWYANGVVATLIHNYPFQSLLGCIRYIRKRRCADCLKEMQLKECAFNLSLVSVLDVG